LIFIVGLALFLLAIGTSTLAAAFANTGYLARQNEFNKIMILDKAIHENMMYSLQADPEDENLLGYQIAWAIYKANDPFYNSDYEEGENNLKPVDDFWVLIDDIEINEFIGTGVVFLESISISFPEQIVEISNPSPAIFEDGSTTEVLVPFFRTPKTATMNARMIVEIVIVIESDASERTITSRAIYQFTGGRLSDDKDGDHSNVGVDVDGNAIEFEMEFLPDGYGEWRLVSYETVDR